MTILLLDSGVSVTATTISLDDAELVIFQRLLTEWSDDGGLTPLTPVNLDDEAMATPDGVPWIRVAVRERDSRIRAMGDGGLHRYERQAVTWIQVFHPLNAGARPSAELAHRARLILEGKRLHPALVFDAARVITLGSDKASWYVRTVEAPFRYYETH